MCQENRSTMNMTSKERRLLMKGIFRKTNYAPGELSTAGKVFTYAALALGLAFFCSPYYGWCLRRWNRWNKLFQSHCHCCRITGIGAITSKCFKTTLLAPIYGIQRGTQSSPFAALCSSLPSLLLALPASVQEEKHFICHRAEHDDAAATSDDDSTILAVQ